MKTSSYLFLLFTLLVTFSLDVPGSGASRELVIDRFSAETEAGGIPKGWEYLTFKKIPNHTLYWVVREGDNFHLKAASKNSSSGIMIQNRPRSGRKRSTERPENFTGKYPPKDALNYIWDNKLPQGTFIDNAYTDRAKMIVVESGKGKAGQWISEERNILEDYRRMFGSDAPEISFIAVMADTDNTGESATSYFDDIVLESR